MGRHGEWGVALLTMTSIAGCAVGIGRTGAAPVALYSSDTAEEVRSSDQSGVAQGYERMTFTGRLLTPADGNGFRCGINLGISYGHQFGSYNGASTGGIAGDARYDAMIAWSNLALIASYSNISMNFDKPEDQMLGNQWSLRAAYAVLPYLAVNAGYGYVTDTSFTRNNMPSLVGPNGSRLLLGVDFFIWQNFAFNVGLRLDAAIGGSSAPFADGTSDTFSGVTLSLQPYVTFW